MRTCLLVLLLIMVWSIVAVSSCAAQFNGNAIISKSDNIELTWSLVLPDYDGEIITYRVWIDYFNQFVDTVGVYPDTSCTVDLKGCGDGYYRFGVQSIDSAGNESDILWCDSPANKYGQWMILRDTLPPMPVGGVRSWFK